jgi:hypothetical protein
VLIRRIILKSNGQPRAWVKNLFFDENLRIKKFSRLILFSSDGGVRQIFFEWYLKNQQNPSPAIDPQWMTIRNYSFNAKSVKKVVIFSPKGTLYVARMLEWRLAQWGIFSHILEEVPHDFFDDLYLVICPQMFGRLPPREKRIVFQMEQSVTKRWFTKEYLNVLYNSIAVFDYSRRNIEYLESKNPGVFNLYHVPIESLPFGVLNSNFQKKMEGNEHQYEVVFYGDPKNARRRKFLSELKKHFDLKIIESMYGPALWNELKKAKLIVNVHYYENALLETTRVNECLSLGLKLISEAASDQDEYDYLSDQVIFTPINDVDAMIQEIKRQLARPTPLLKSNAIGLIKSEDKLFSAFKSLGLLPN